MAIIYAHPTVFRNPYQLQRLQFITGRIAVPYGHAVRLVTNELRGRRKPRPKLARNIHPTGDDAA